MYKKMFILSKKHLKIGFIMLYIFIMLLKSMIFYIIIIDYYNYNNTGGRMPKFDKRFIHCVWDDSLNGKSVFVADEIGCLQRVVEVNDTAWFRNITGKSTCAPFPFVADPGICFRFCYHDPYYELKLAREEGKVIQKYWKSEQEWDEYIGDDFPDDISLYRIKPEEQKPVTSREISRWLAQGNGEYRAYNDKVFPDVRRTEYLYEQDTEPVTNVKIRKWEDEEWHEPTREYMGLEG